MTDSLVDAYLARHTIVGEERLRDKPKEHLWGRLFLNKVNEQN